MASSGYKPGRLLNIPQCTDSPPPPQAPHTDVTNHYLAPNNSSATWRTSVLKRMKAWIRELDRLGLKHVCGFFARDLQ